MTYLTWAVDISLPNLRPILLKVILAVIIVFDLIYNKLPICLFRRIFKKRGYSSLWLRVSPFKSLLRVLHVFIFYIIEGCLVNQIFVLFIYWLFFNRCAGKLNYKRQKEKEQLEKRQQKHDRRKRWESRTLLPPTPS